MAVRARARQHIRVDDASLRENVLHAIHAAPDLEREDIEVSVVEGWVTLRGAVDAYWKKGMADDLIRPWADVRGVTNQLAVVPSRAYEDELIAESIVSALIRDIHVDVNAIDVRVEEGHVTLSGKIPSLPAFRLAQTIAEHAPGVAGMDNDLEIG